MKSHIHQLLDHYKVHLEIDPLERKNIPDNGPFVVIANRLLPGIDELAILEVFRNKAGFQLLLPPAKHLHLPLQTPSILSTPTENDLFSSIFYPTHLDALESALRSGIPIGLFVDPLPGRFDSLRGFRFQRRLFKRLRRLGVPVVSVMMDAGRHTPALQLTAEGLQPFSQKQALHLRIGQPLSPGELKGLKVPGA